MSGCFGLFAEKKMLEEEMLEPLVISFVRESMSVRTLLVVEEQC